MESKANVYSPQSLIYNSYNSATWWCKPLIFQTLPILHWKLRFFKTNGLQGISCKIVQYTYRLLYSIHTPYCTVYIQTDYWRLNGKVHQINQNLSKEINVFVKFTGWNIKFTGWNIKFTVWNIKFTGWNIKFTGWNIKFTGWNIKYLRHQVAKKRKD